MKKPQAVPSIRTVSAEQLLAEADEILRSVPTEADLARNDNTAAWRGRVSAVVSAWNLVKGGMDLQNIWNQYDNGVWALENGATMRRLLALLYEMRHALLMETGASNSIAIDAGNPFHYFDELTKHLQLAKQDVLFVDPYLDAEFAGRYLPQIDKAATVRLLTSKRVASLLPAVDLYVQQEHAAIQVREATLS